MLTKEEEFKIALALIRKNKTCSHSYKSDEYRLVCLGDGVEREHTIACPFYFMDKNGFRICNAVNIYGLILERYSLQNIIRECLEDEK
jgi:hypothetical protein